MINLIRFFGFTLLVVCAMTACRPTDSEPRTRLDTTQPIDEQMVHSAKRADLATIGYFWQMDEPVWLTSLLDAKEVYRLWYKPSLYDWSVVRVVRTDKSWVLSVRTLDSRDRRTLSKCLFAKEQSNPVQCRYPKLKVNRERDLQPHEIEKMLRHLKRLDFWKQPERVKSLPDFDGVNWMLEGVGETGQMRELHRYNPAEPGAFYQFADYLLTLAEVPRP
jgi:hypothetical protein